jgi:hypothetical protein
MLQVTSAYNEINMRIFTLLAEESWGGGGGRHEQSEKRAGKRRENEKAWNITCSYKKWKKVSVSEKNKEI